MKRVKSPMGRRTTTPRPGREGGGVSQAGRGSRGMCPTGSRRGTPEPRRGRGVGGAERGRRMASLEVELKELYQYEAELQTKVQAQAQRERQFATLSAERDALAKRVDALERELAAARRRR